MCNLIFFACHPATTSDSAIRIRWENKRATGLFILDQLVPESASSTGELLAVRLADNETDILGQFKRVDNVVVFEPLIPFTRGLRYGLWRGDKRLGEITIPTLDSGDRPTLLAMYPTQDSLPENLLKIYLHFSRPMREGLSQRYVTVLQNRTDTVPGVFLGLQPELWNPDRTVLTLWLDPGRIKRDLQPNRKMGTPLQMNTRYQFIVSGQWPDQQGATLGNETVKSFVTTSRDSLSPNPAEWLIQEPVSGSVKPLMVAFGEPLDYSLVTETFHLMDEAGNAVAGKWQSGCNEKCGLFRAQNPWKAGRYRLRIESRLEDLAGNNLNRPFDRDITRQQNPVSAQLYQDRFFRIR